MTSLRAAIIDCLRLDETGFRERLPQVADAHRLDSVDTVSDPADLAPSTEGYTPFERTMVARLRRFDAVPLGLTLTGPAYQDNPVRYATATFRSLTGYSLSALRGENLRLLQGPATESAAIADLREAIDIWERTTVEVWNYRKDGTAFRNRVTVVPLSGPDGTVTNWLGVQASVGPSAD